MSTAKEERCAKCGRLVGLSRVYVDEAAYHPTCGPEPEIARLQEQVETLTKERDTCARAATMSAKIGLENSARAEAAEAERDRLREALQEYENPSNWSVNGRFDANSPSFDGTSFAHGVLAAQERDDAR